MKLGLVLLGAVTVAVGLPGELRAQADDRQADRVRIAVQRQPRMNVGLPTWADPPVRRLGILVLEPPVMPGELIRLRLPVGELVLKVARGVVAKNQRRREVGARREVQTALTAFLAKASRAPD